MLTMLPSVNLAKIDTNGIQTYVQLCSAVAPINQRCIVIVHSDQCCSYL